MEYRFVIGQLFLILRIAEACVIRTNVQNFNIAEIGTISENSTNIWNYLIKNFLFERKKGFWYISHLNLIHRTFFDHKHTTTNSSIEVDKPTIVSQIIYKSTKIHDIKNRIDNFQKINFNKCLLLQPIVNDFSSTVCFACVSFTNLFTEIWQRWLWW